MTELQTENNRINELDGLRGMAILAAVLYHYANNLIDADASKFNLFLKSITLDNSQNVKSLLYLF